LLEVARKRELLESGRGLGKQNQLQRIVGPIRKRNLGGDHAEFSSGLESRPIDIGSRGFLHPAGEVADTQPVHGVGRVDLVEDRLVGMKSRGIYETPGGTLLYTAHSELEQLTLDRRTLATKDLIASRYADLVYEGRWWTTERAAYDALVSVTQQHVTGTVTLSLYKGNVTIAGRTSPFALYDERFVTFGADDVYQQADAAGFIRLFALPQRVAALQARERAAALADTAAHSAPDFTGTDAEIGEDAASGAAVAAV